MVHPIKISTVIAFAIAMLSLMNSCKTSKDLRKSPPPLRSQSEIETALNTRNISFQYFYGKADLSFESTDQSGSGSLQIRMVKDSLAWMMVKKFGLEAARVLANPDSAYILSRFEHVCQEGSIRNVTGKLGISLTFEDLQQLMVGNVMLPEQEEVISYNQDDYKCTLTSRNSDFAISYTIDAYDLTLINYVIKDRRNKVANISLSDYRKTNDGQLSPYFRKLEFSMNGKTIGSSEIVFSEIVIDEEKPIVFNIPNSYDRISF